jgi:hypothetical protein
LLPMLAGSWPWPSTSIWPYIVNTISSACIKWSYSIYRPATASHLYLLLPTSLLGVMANVYMETQHYGAGLLATLTSSV